MDDETKDFIRANIVRLAAATNFNTPLLNELYSAMVLTGHEMDIIKTTATKIDKSTEFYQNILPNKPQECYDKTIHALSRREVEQSPAAHILMELKDQSSNTERETEGETSYSVSVMQSMGDGVHVNIERLLTILREVGDRKFILLSINGKMRHGKSFMMSCILSYLRSNRSTAWMQEMTGTPRGSPAFKWRSGREAETKGIHIWPHPLMIRDINDEEIAVILMDCQGAFDDETSTHQNSLIFAMSTLMSSVLIYNVLDRITEADIQPFLVFMQTALQAGDEHRDGDGRKPFQSLILLNRDVHAETGQLNNGYYTETATPGNCPKNLFRETFYPSTSVNEIRKSREPILNNFNNIGLYALPYPGEAIRDDNISNLNREFITKTTEFMDLLFKRDNLALKIIGGGNPLTGNDYIPYCKALGETFNRNTIPHVKSFLDAVTEGQLAVVINKVMEEYNTKMSQFTSTNAQGFSSQDVQNHNSVISVETLDAFAQRSVVVSPELQARFGNLLQLEIEVAHQTFQVAEANKRLAALNSSASKYWYDKPIVTKHRNRFMGVVVSPSYSTTYVRTFNDALYNSDAALAKSEIATANVSLEAAKLAQRTFNL